jgi:hypothetical protein
MTDHHKIIAQDCLLLGASQLHQAAETLPHGDKRKSLKQKALKMENAALVIERWASSPGLEPPE